ncbi:unnamed protein product [Moneuplotes crassus]|uniref:Ubiquitin-like domain-containing protein n=1 Tax=Euplotes crassus TaxID=5936 RepID=A0AAD1Y0Y7_EUPCR|nr:unnamed protein product [Moneuplotes crassus]
MESNNQQNTQANKAADEGSKTNDAAPGPSGMADPGDGHINIKVKNQEGTEIFFKIKKTTNLKKLMDAYCSRQGLMANSCRFIFDGERLRDTDTPNALEMENGDEIDVMVEQTGGSLARAFSHTLAC